MSEDELALRGNNGMVPLGELDDILGDTEGRSDNLLDTLAVYRQGKDDYFNIGEEREQDVVGIFLLSARPSRAMWMSEELTGSSPDCFSFDGVRPHEVVENPGHADCADCPFNKMGSGQGRQKKCKTKANDFVLLVSPKFQIDGETEQAIITPKEIVGPGLINYSIGNKGASRSWQSWLREVKESGARPQGVVARWSFGKDRSKTGNVEYAFVKVETLAPLPSPSEAPDLWSAIVQNVQSLKGGDKENILLALSGGGADDSADEPQL